MRSLNRGPVESVRKPRLKQGDKVVVISGAHKGAGPAEVVKVIPEKSQVIVRDVNLVTKHLRKTQENPEGGIERREAPIHYSNVLLYSEKAGKGVRVRIEERDGKRVRVGVPCGTVFD
jgi:large subunit ribosomal protein L24